LSPHNKNKASLLLLEWSHGLLLLLDGLEASVAELGCGVDELEGNDLGGTAVGLGEQRLTQGDDALLHAGDGTLEHDVVLVDLSVVREATNRGDALDSQIKLSGSVVWCDLVIRALDALGNAVDLLVDLGTVMVTVLTGTWDSV